MKCTWNGCGAEGLTDIRYGRINDGILEERRGTVCGKHFEALYRVAHTREEADSAFMQSTFITSERCEVNLNGPPIKLQLADE